LSGQVQGEDHQLYQRRGPGLFALGPPDTFKAPVEHPGPFISRPDARPGAGRRIKQQGAPPWGRLGVAGQLVAEPFEGQPADGFKFAGGCRPDPVSGGYCSLPLPHASDREDTLRRASAHFSPG
jgi:hypothetical protein